MVNQIPLNLEKQITMLKKLFALIVIATMGIGAANAEFRFGIKAGLNVNNLHLNDPKQIFDKDNGTGWTAGVMTEFQVPLIGLCFDLSLMYTRMNTDFDEIYPSQPGNDLLANQLNLGKNFIEIPLDIKYKISLPVVGNIISPYIFTGPAFAFKLDKNTFQYFKSKTCQVAWNVGLGLQLVKHLQIGASYGFGLNNVANFTGLVNAEQVKVKNNYWTITAAYLF